MTAARVLVPLTYGFSVRYAVPTGLLEQLAEICEPVVGLGWDDPELVDQLRSEGFEVVRLPDAEVTHEYRNHAKRMDRLHALRLSSPTTRIRHDRWKRRGFSKKRFVEEARWLRDGLDVRRPGGAAALEAADRGVLHRESNLSEFLQLLGSGRFAGVLSFTPYHDQDILLLVAASELDLSVSVSVISFDNPTIRGRLAVIPDLVMVWNREMAQQLVRSHPDLDAASVRVVGAPQFDLHRRTDLVEEERSWRQGLGLPPDRPVILFGAGPSRLVPGEHRLVEVLDRAIAAGRLPGDPCVLVRRHPVDSPEVWAQHAARFDHAVVADPWAAGASPKRSWPTSDDLRSQMSSLAHATVHVNVCSSMTVDGAMFDRPQVGPTFVPGASRLQQSFVRDFYRQEHWEPIASSGGLVLAADPDELTDAVSAGLTDPTARSEQRAQLVRNVLTWPDGRSTRRLVDEVGSLLERRSR